MSVDRRLFLKLSALAGGGLMLGFTLPACSSKPSGFPNQHAGALQANAFLQLTQQGQFILQLHRAEMGQGVYTGMATLAAEELDLSPEQLQIEHAQYHPDFADPEMKLMLTGGSSSIRNSYHIVREAAASFAHILRLAATQLDANLNTSQALPELLSAVKQGGAWAEYLVLAGQISAPDEIVLKSPKDFQQIGQHNQRLDALDKITGKAQYAMDVQVPNALDAVLLRCPQLGGKVLSFKAETALASSNVVKIIEVTDGIAVIAKGYWYARKAAKLVQIEWQTDAAAKLNTAELLIERQHLLDTEEGYEAEEIGNKKDAVGERFEAQYEVPYLAHACMEPLSAIADVSAHKVTLWAGNQAPDVVIGAVAKATGIDKSLISFHNQMLGGGFGRKTLPDYIVQAALISQAAGMPIRLQWSREEDIQHDYYRPSATARLSATIAENNPTSLHSRVSSPSVLGSYLPAVATGLLPGWLPESLPNFAAGVTAKRDYSSTEGLTHSPYQFAYKRCDYVLQKQAMPVGYWRSVGHSQNAFFLESFIDELAHRCQQDPLAFRRHLMAEDEAHTRVLNALESLSRWGQLEANQFQGVAIHKSFGTIVGEVLTLSKGQNGLVIERVDCVVDCGLVINPDIVIAQMESGIIFGLTAALKGKIDVIDGAVQQSNFHDYPLLRLNESPQIRVRILDSEQAPQGVGEPATPPIAPALANALFAATGKRQRALPLSMA
ncbi:xanthine dehydrogenase family protein molybdopterin-binding subunit [Spongiibacter sp. KMU-158]|uniref:Xanthine dehydrogenase family protein molybdopterin-binding subunit n=1 Tax=Spongiibacter pelagi TaxID=2760804 RepID=A0A927C4J3_9GAMM|nr:molybdopterin cofactor-binding domain-containing protein [Spongiibacter pelagi]MBD2859882.1 xanthine dehydrogenase family protein molybdopterin-binding subunit [Spongiibacter pelagi]